MKPLLIPALLALALLAGCSGDDYMTNAACRQEVYDNPQVGHRIEMGFGRHFWPNGEESLTALKKQVYVDCLRKRGLAPKGGVEPVKSFY